MHVIDIETGKIIENIAIPSELNPHLETIKKFITDFKSKTGKKIYLIGGALRNALLRAPIKDLDFATNASTEEIKSHYTIKEVGAHFEVNLVTFEDKTYEVARFRTESSFSNKRTDVKVEFTDSIIEDLNRRDFTINTLALSFNAEGQPYIECTKEAYNDIDKRIMRFQGNASERIKEDPLRILRCLRITLQNWLYIDDTIVYPILANIKTLETLSKERIRDELIKILENINKSVIYKDLFKLFEIVLIKIFSMVDFSNLEFPECLKNPFSNIIDYDQNSKYHALTLDLHILNGLIKCSKYREETLSGNKIEDFHIAMLLHDLGKPYVAKFNEKTGFTNYINHHKVSMKIADIFLKHYKFSNNSYNRIMELIKYHSEELPIEEASGYQCIRLRNKLKYVTFEDMARFKFFDNITKKDNLYVYVVRDIDDIEKERNKVIKEYTEFLGADIRNHKDLCFDIVPVLKERLPDNKLKEALLEVTNWVIKQKRNNEKDIMSFIKCKY